MTREDWVILYLSIQLLVMSVFMLRAEHKIGYLEGRNSVYSDIQEAVNDVSGPYSGSKKHG